MRARTHVLLTYLLTAPFLGVERAITASLSAILPDLDHPNSLVSSALYPLELLTGRDLRLALSRRLRHRGILHCPWPWGALAYLLWATGHPNAALVPLGGFLHCLEDAFTTMGVPVMWRREGGSWRSVRLSLTGLPSDTWDAILPPLALAVTWALFLLNPAEFHATHLDENPYLERAYWTSRAVLLRPFLHTVEGLNREALRVSGYGRLPHVRAVLRYDYGPREVSGLWTPAGWVRGDDGRWYPPPTHGYSLRSLSYERAAYRVGTVRCWDAPEGALVLRAVLAYEGLSPVALERLAREAVLLGFRVRHTDRVGGHLVLEGGGLAIPVLHRLPRPAWCRVTFLPSRSLR
ncbi:metal-dependent hydrolase [Methanopyrus kandleri]|uniref:Predicted membrane-bound metal-dependent hydrolase n=1 Tax=Methanopyrus kandleri (strain AV19 / DSM 6324 / JCM 9639 / NBRC 100938) TaxID=190192 RepID=Q8TVQ4_METKA|nr:metal-dependent hydrolase [Methanopyrus kandleri]AAM02547.1 Predicted membrane-bound metal-dependent hydrolase [Methanopyrus kandleri AV19]